MRKLTTEAIVLKHTDYKDTHRIYTLLTRERGKITAVARGVRKISSKRSGSLDSLNYVKLSLNEEKSGMFSIGEVQSINSFSELKKNLDHVFIGMYFAELVDVFLESDHESYEIFKLLKSALTVLNKNPDQPKVVINVFEMRLLELLGLGVHLDFASDELTDYLDRLKTATNLSSLMDQRYKLHNQADHVIKGHLAKMVETYAKFPRLNKFLNEVV
jgi:DNA repair protein RecO